MGAPGPDDRRSRRSWLERLLLLVVGASIVSGCSVIFGEHNDSPSSRLRFDNQTTGTITVTYELEPGQIDENHPPDPLRIPPGAQGSLAPIPSVDYCTQAPVVVTDDADRELLRLPSGYCLDEEQSNFDIEEG